MRLHLSRSRKYNANAPTEIRREGNEEEGKGEDGGEDVHLALKVLHYIQKVVVHVRFIMELHLDRVQVAQRVRHIQRPIIVGAVALNSVGSRGSGGPVSAAVLHRHRVGLDRRWARAGTQRRAGERVVRTQSGRWWRRLRRLYWIAAAATSTITGPRALSFVGGRSRLWRARIGSRLTGACDGKRLGW